jgi:choline-sulfatase/uncharacterized sulfatase
MNNKPNIIFLLSDQHNAKVMGHKGHPDVQTPNLDKLAEEGVRFDNAITQNPICTPSRVSWLSGQYCHNHGYYGLDGPNPRGLPSILGHFRKSGYKTAAIGKIHCPAYWIEDDCDIFHDTCDCSVEGRSSQYTEYLKSRGLLDKEDHIALNEFGDKGRQSVDARPSTISYKDGQEGWAVAESIKFMQECHQQNQPFFAHISLPKPHQCYTPAPEFWNLYDESKISLPPNADYDMKDKAPNLKRTAEMWRNSPWQLFEPKTFEAGRLRKLHGYLGSVSHVDHAVGEVLNWLKQQGLEENTIVVYSTDHGDYACEHGIMEKAPGICSDAITRIPCIWKWKGHFKTGHIAKEIIETVDMANTLCALTGIDPMETSDGKNISPLLQGQNETIKEFGVTEFAWSKSIRKGNYRLVYYPKELFADDYPNGFGELYDLEADPWEMQNLYFQQEYQDKILELQKDLFDWLITSTRPTTVIREVKSDFPGQNKERYNHSVNFDGKIHPDRIRNSEMIRSNYI